MSVVASTLTAEQLTVRDTLRKCLSRGIPVDPIPATIPPKNPAVPHAPRRVPNLSEDDFELAVANALRYFPSPLHATLAPEFAEELRTEGHIYMRRFKPTEYEMRAYPVDWYPANHPHARCIMLMVQNNLDPRVAQFPEELITYGGNGSVLSNWAQYHLLMKYLSDMTDSQTLVMCSGHPQGLFPSSPAVPRVVISNGMTIPNYSTRRDYDRMYALGVSMYGQMTAGSYCYIGPQGIVHGTTITILNAGRKYLPAPANTNDNVLAGKVYLSSGLGGMSGAQGKAGTICGAVTVLAEVDETALDKRLAQGWVTEKVTDIEALVKRVKEARAAKEAVAIAYLGNIVTVWERFAQEVEQGGELLAELGSDQTSLHNPFGGGYYPVQLSFEEGKEVMTKDPARFTALVQESLRRHVAAVNTCVKHGTRFWDYGNCFLLESARAGADILIKDEATSSSSKSSSSSSAKSSSSSSSEEKVQSGSDLRFKYPSYVQEFMGDIFSLGFGPFRWVCCSGDEADLKLTDAIAAAVLRTLLHRGTDREDKEQEKERESSEVKSDVAAGNSGDLVSTASWVAKLGISGSVLARTGLFDDAGAEPVEVQDQLRDNLLWIEQAFTNRLVVGSQARILYADSQARCAIASAFNVAVARGLLRGPVVLSRDHHDVSGTDSPFRETSNVYDGSAFCADMAVQNVIGDSMRGATWVALHNGGGVGWGEVVNGGFGLVLDGTKEALDKSQNMLFWDVNNGVSRRAWSGNSNAALALRRAHAANPLLNVTVAEHVDRTALKSMISHSSSSSNNTD